MEVKEIKGAVEEALAPVAEQVKEVKTAATAAKTAAEAAQAEAKKATDTATTIDTEVKGLKDWQVKKDEADKKNQDALDKLIIDNQKQKVVVGTEQHSFKSLLAESIEEHKDAIAKFANKERREASFQMKAVGDMALN